MRIAEIISVGTELLHGLTQDTNATYLAREFREMGFCLRHRQTCGDDREDLTQCIRLALSRSDVVVITGGLGPTYDDVTRDAVVAVTGRKLVSDPETEARIRAFFIRRGREMKENNLLQAMVPEGAEVLPNDWGTAPGVWLESEGKRLILLPGVPREMKALWQERVRPRLIAFSGKRSYTAVLHLIGIPESELDERIPAVYKNGADPVVTPFAGTGEVELHITSFRDDPAEAEAAVHAAQAELLREFSAFCYGCGQDTLESVLVSRFREAGLTLSGAESCTGGLLSKRITDVPGSSVVWKSGVVAYTEEMKTKLLGVTPDVFAGPGVYSKACAVAMARGVRRLTDSDFGVGITGIAGPDGGNDADPVGTVYIAVSSFAGERVERFVFGHGAGERGFIRHLAASHALAMVLEESGLFCLMKSKK